MKIANEPELAYLRYLIILERALKKDHGN